MIKNWLPFVSGPKVSHRKVDPTFVLFTMPCTRFYGWPNATAHGTWNHWNRSTCLYAWDVFLTMLLSFWMKAKYNHHADVDVFDSSWFNSKWLSRDISQIDSLERQVRFDWCLQENSRTFTRLTLYTSQLRMWFVIRSSLRLLEPKEPLAVMLKKTKKKLNKKKSSWKTSIFFEFLIKTSSLIVVVTFWNLQQLVTQSLDLVSCNPFAQTSIFMIAFLKPLPANASIYGRVTFVWGRW